ncbi:MAG: epimerase [Thiotrichaceae bacterium IS1]|nr:MAG: epimerase [Thiotrichaceae bacterium IS1]
MKVLVTGATGFIGNHVVQTLLNLNYEVVASSRSIEKAKQFAWFEKVIFVGANLRETKENYFEYFQKPDALIHLSWEGLPNYKDLFHFEENLFSNYFFLKNMVEHGLKDLLVTGTCFEYGMQSGGLYENLETKPNNPYGLAKDTLRKFLEQLKIKIDFHFKWVRLFYLYGKGQNPNSVLSQLDRALQSDETVFNMSGGEQLRDYLPVEKVAEYIVKIALQNQVTGIINCCSGNPISIRRLVENYLTEQKKSIKLNLGCYPYPDYEPMAFWGNPLKLESCLAHFYHTTF